MVDFLPADNPTTLLKLRIWGGEGGGEEIKHAVDKILLNFTKINQ